MFDERDDRETSGQTLLDAERSDSRLAEGGRAGEFSWTNADAPTGPLARTQRGERPTAEPRDRPASEPKERPAPEPRERPAAEPKARPASEPKAPPSEGEAKPGAPS